METVVEFDGMIEAGGCTVFTAQLKEATLLKELHIHGNLSGLQINDLKLASKTHSRHRYEARREIGAKPALATLDIEELGVGRNGEQITLSVTNNGARRRFSAHVTGIVR